MANFWLKFSTLTKKGRNRKCLLSCLYAVLLSISYLTEIFNPATKQLFCTAFGTSVIDRTAPPSTAIPEGN
jgi:hypothetical protein